MDPAQTPPPNIWKFPYVLLLFFLKASLTVYYKNSCNKTIMKENKRIVVVHKQDI